MRDDFLKLLDEGKQLLEKKEVQDAILNLELALEKAYLMGSDKDAVIASELLGKSYDMLKDHDKAIEHYANNLAIYEDMQDVKSKLRTLNKIGLIYNAKNDLQKAVEYFMRALEVCKEVDDKESEAVLLKNIGKIHSKLGNHVLALKAHTASLDLQRKLGDRRGEALGLFYVGQSQVDSGDYETAKGNLENALGIFNNLGLKDDAKKVQLELDELAALEAELDVELDVSSRFKGKLRNKFIADDFIRMKR